MFRPEEVLLGVVGPPWERGRPARPNFQRPECCAHHHRPKRVVGGRDASAPREKLTYAVQFRSDPLPSIIEHDTVVIIEAQGRQNACSSCLDGLDVDQQEI